jgi:nucleotide-binding universal stress UspA family protein
MGTGMDLTSIVTLVTPEAALDGKVPALDTALALADALTVGVVVLCAGIDAAAPGRDGPDVAAAQAAIAARSAARGVTCEVTGRRHADGGLGAAFAGLLKVADLAVLPLRHRAVPAERLVLDAALFESGRPVLVTAGALASLPRRILVAWDDGPAAVRATTAALPLLARAAEVVVAEVEEGKSDRLPKADPGPTAYLARHGVTATFRNVPRGKGEVFADLAAAAAGFDLLVCGAVRRSRAQEVLFGGVTGAILSAAVDMPVLLMA